MRNPKAFPCLSWRQTKRVQSQLEPLSAGPKTRVTWRVVASPASFPRRESTLPALSPVSEQVRSF